MTDPPAVRAVRLLKLAADDRRLNLQLFCDLSKDGVGLEEEDLDDRPPPPAPEDEGDDRAPGEDDNDFCDLFSWLLLDNSYSNLSIDDWRRPKRRGRLIPKPKTTVLACSVGSSLGRDLVGGLFDGGCRFLFEAKLSTRSKETFMTTQRWSACVLASR